MRTTYLLTMALVPAALIAQAPASAPAPAPAAVPAAAPAPALTFTQRFKAEQGGINQLLKAFQPEEALGKAEALLPAVKPVFDQSSLNAGRNCSFQFSDLARTYHLAGKCAVAFGNWEKGRDYFIKAQVVAKENVDQTTAVVTPTIETWKAPVAAAHQALEEGAARRAELKAKEPRTPAEDVELKNFTVHDDNIAKGEKVMKVLNQDIAGTKTELTAFGPMIDSIKKAIADEKAEMDKEIASKAFKGSREKYLAAILNPKNLETRTTKQDKLNFLFRLQFHCAGTPQAAKVKAVIDRVRADEDPFPPEKHGKKKKNS